MCDGIGEYNPQPVLVGDHVHVGPAAKDFVRAETHR